MIARPELPTIPIAIYRFLSLPGVLNYGQALAMSTILMTVCVAGFVAMERLRPREYKVSNASRVIFCANLCVLGRGWIHPCLVCGASYVTRFYFHALSRNH